MLLEDMRRAALLPKSAEEQGDNKASSTDEDDFEPGQKKRKLETLRE